MGDSRRFDLMAKLAASHIPLTTHVVDVAAGKGYMQAALRERGFAAVTSWDKRPQQAKGRKFYRYGYFDFRSAPRDYGAVVAMHPDEGTDHAVMYAVKHRVPALICPCCVKPSAVMFNRRHTFHAWVEHLVSLAEAGHMEVQTAMLRMNGKNLVLILKPSCPGGQA